MSLFDRYLKPGQGQAQQQEPIEDAPPKTNIMPPALASVEPTPDGTTDYAAYTHEPTNKRSPARLRVEYGDGGVALMAYAYLMEVYCPSHQHLSLIFTNVVITLKGHRLDQLLEPLQESKARSIHCFNPNRYEQPAAGKPLITAIKRESLQDAARATKPATNAKS